MLESREEQAVQIFPYGSPYEQLLKAVASMFNTLYPHMEFFIELALFDACHNRFWTTIYTREKSGGKAQPFMTPAEQGTLLFGDIAEYEALLQHLKVRTVMQSTAARERKETTMKNDKQPAKEVA